MENSITNNEIYEIMDNIQASKHPFINLDEWKSQIIKCISWYEPINLPTPFSYKLIYPDLIKVDIKPLNYDNKITEIKQKFLDLLLNEYDCHEEYE